MSQRVRRSGDVERAINSDRQHDATAAKPLAGALLIVWIEMMLADEFMLNATGAHVCAGRWSAR